MRFGRLLSSLFSWGHGEFGVKSERLTLGQDTDTVHRSGEKSSEVGNHFI